MESLNKLSSDIDMDAYNRNKNPVSPPLIELVIRNVKNTLWYSLVNIVTAMRINEENNDKIQATYN
jgi:hypothetical protein